MKKEKLKQLEADRKQRGFTLLEYVAGASVLLAVVYVGLNQMGTSLSDLFRDIGQWATDRGDEIIPPQP